MTGEFRCLSVQLFSLVPIVLAPRELCDPSANGESISVSRGRFKGNGRGNMLRDTGAFFKSLPIPTMLHKNSDSCGLGQQEGRSSGNGDKQLAILLPRGGYEEAPGPRAFGLERAVSFSSTGLFP